MALGCSLKIGILNGTITELNGGILQQTMELMPNGYILLYIPTTPHKKFFAKQNQTNVDLYPPKFGSNWGSSPRSPSPLWVGWPRHPAICRSTDSSSRTVRQAARSCVSAFGHARAIVYRYWWMYAYNIWIQNYYVCKILIYIYNTYRL